MRVCVLNLALTLTYNLLHKISLLTNLSVDRMYIQQNILGGKILWFSRLFTQPRMLYIK